MLMATIRLWLAFVVFAQLAFASFASIKAAQLERNVPVTYAGQEIVPGSFLIEVGGGSLSKRDGAAHLSRVLSYLASPSSNFSGTALPPFSATRQLTARPSLFHGAVIEVNDPALLEELALGGESTVKEILQGFHGVEGIERAWPLRILRGAAPVRTSAQRRAETTESPTSDAAHAASFAKRSGTNFPPPSAYANDTFSPHVMTGVANLHNQGIIGSSDIKVAVIDSGVDYLNPILGGCFGPGCLISFGGDYTTDPPGPTPYTSCNHHGTHVTGTVAALANSYGFSGVAPGVQIGHYRTGDCDDSSREDHIVAALLAAANDHVNVINQSTGRRVGWLDVDPSQLVIERLAAQENIVVTVSAGNSGAAGPFFAFSPASSTGAISVGAVNVAQLPAFPAQVDTFGILPYLSSTPLNTSTVPASNDGYRVYFTSTTAAVSADACDSLPASTPDLSASITVIRRGGCPLQAKMSNVASKGGKIALIYNTPDALNLTTDLEVGTTGLAVIASLRDEEGTKLLEWYNSRSGNLHISFPQGMAPIFLDDNISSGLLWSLSNWGPTFELFGQPSLAGPGSNILSTLPLGEGGFGVLSGTSMSAPFLAGAAALVLSQRKSDSLASADVRALLTTTASKLPAARNASTFETVLLQGGGLVQVDKAISTRTIVSPFELMLNDTAFPAAKQTITLRNTNAFSMQYTFSSSSTQAYAAYDNDASTDPFISMQPQPIIPQAEHITFSTQQITVEPGQTYSCAVTILPPSFSPVELARFPLYSGFIDISGRSNDHSHAEELHIPYFGLAAKMGDMPVLDSTARVYNDVAYPFIISDNFTIFDSPGALSASQEFTVLLRLAAGTRFFSVDVILSSDAPPTTIPTQRRTASPPGRLDRRTISTTTEAMASSLHTYNKRSASAPLFSDTPVVGSIARIAFPSHRDYFADRAPNDFTERQFPFVPNRAAFQMGQSVQYRVLVRALKITADPTLASSYESWVSYPFTLSP
ncbi:hypothetical protein JCM10296v2_006977 [Rhodotorula toruloides]